MAVIIHDSQTLCQSLSLEFQLIKEGYKFDISKLGYKAKDDTYTIRQRDELLIRTKSLDTSIFHPVFYSLKSLPETNEYIEIADWDVSIINPAAIGYTFLGDGNEKENSNVTKNTFEQSSTEYLNETIFPILIPALEEMLRVAQSRYCFMKTRTAFNALDFIVEYLYKNNPKTGYDRSEMTLGDIPFVSEHWKHHPRKPLPKSLIWTNAEASLIIQSAWRGYLVRKNPEIQELRQWQKDWRERNKDIHEKVKKFWEERDEASSRLSSHKSQEFGEDTLII